MPPNDDASADGAAFVTEADREAVATIAGFCYQVDQTISHWIDLPDDEELALEGGEDIDVIAPALAAESFDQERLVTQVKRLSGNVTLRSDSAIAAVAHLAGHKKRNPSVQVRFRFLTTTRAGRERPNPFTPRGEGLIRWNELRAGAIQDDDGAVLSALHALLKEAEQPNKGVSDDDWSELQSLLAEPPGIGTMRLVRDLAWVLGARDSAELAEASRGRLVDSGLCTETHEAELAYEALFVQVFRLLATPGIRTLRRSDLQRLIGERRTLVDTQIGTRVRARLTAVEGRLSRIERALGGHGRRLDEHDDVLALLAGIVSRDHASGTGRADHGAPDPAVGGAMQALLGRLGPVLTPDRRPSLAPPPVSPRAVPRPRAEAGVGKALSAQRWLHVWGSIRTGKTSLIRRTVDGDASNTLWVRLRGLGGDDSMNTLQSAVWGSGLPGEPTELALARRVGAGGILVLDDLPDLGSALDLASFLLQLLAALPPDARLITIGPGQLPRGVLTGGPIGELRAPRFDAEELRLLFAARGAPERVTGNAALLVQILAATEGHAERLNQCAAVLTSRHWAFDLAALQAIFTPVKDEQQRTAALRQVGATVAPGPARDLLFRLCVPGGQFGDEMVRAVAEIEPELDHPGVLRAQIDGLWLEAEADARWSVSPAIEPFGAGELRRDTLVGVHRAVAEQCLGTGALTPVQAARVIHHFECGDDVDSAGAVLIQYLRCLIQERAIARDPGLAERWPRSLPKGMSPEVRLMVRAMQGKALAARGADARARLNQVLDEIRARSAESWAVLGAAFVAQDAAHAVDTNLAAELLDHAFSAIAAGPLAEEYAATPILTAQLHMAHVSRPPHVDAWVRLLRHFSPDELAKWSSVPEFASSARVMTNRLWMEESDRPEAQRDWASVEAALTRLAEAGRSFGMPVLTAAATAALIVVHSDRHDRIDRAIDIWKEARPTLPGGVPIAMIDDVIGRQLVYKQQEREGIPHLESALATYPSDPPLALDRFHALQALVLGHSRLDRTSAAEAAKRAVAQARAEPRWIGELELVGALGELAIAQWRHTSVLHAWPAFDEAGERLLAQHERDDRWRDRFVVYGHVSGYFSSIAASGEPPPSLAGGEPYAAPRPGMFFTWVRGRPLLYQERLAAILPSQLAGFAVAAGDLPRAWTWARRAIDLATEARIGHMAAEAQRVVAVQELREHRVGEGLRRLLQTLLALEQVRMRHLNNDIDYWAPSEVPPLEAAPADRQRLIAGWLSHYGFYAVAVALVQMRSEELEVQSRDMAAFYDEIQAVIGGEAVAADVTQIAIAAADLASSGARATLNEFAGRSPVEFDRAPCAVAHLLLSRPELSPRPEDRLVRHIRFARAVDRSAGELDHLYHLVIVPFFLETWARFAAESGFALRRPPALVRDTLARVASGDRQHRLRHTLLVMADGLGLNVDASTRAWLMNGRE